MESGQCIVHSTSTPTISALTTRTTMMNALKPEVLTSQLARMLGGLNREFKILTRFLRLSAAVTRFRDCVNTSTHNVLYAFLIKKIFLANIDKRFLISCNNYVSELCDAIDRKPIPFACAFQETQTCGRPVNTVLYLPAALREAQTAGS